MPEPTLPETAGDSKPHGRSDKMNRRTFLAATAAASAVAVGALSGFSGIFGLSDARARDSAPFDFPNLPYAQDALDPVISGRTIGFHYGKHHKAYFQNTNDLVRGTRYATLPLEEIVRTAASDPGATAIFNNAAQFWNHTFYWNSLTPNGGGEPGGNLAAMIRSQYGDMGTLRDQLVQAATSQFGSGWAWLVLDRDKLATVQTANADNPLTRDMVPLLTIDVWEHAYYLDYQNARKAYVEAVLDKIVNWKFAEANFRKAAG